MKTAISLSNKLFYLTEEYAEKHGITRNQLFATAVRQFIKHQKKIEKKGITQKINDVCAIENTSLNPQIKIAAKQILVNAEW
ncbi:ChpI protein [Candidatus Magnetomoraceae bacterium gMMP-15]